MGCSPGTDTTRTYGGGIGLNRSTGSRFGVNYEDRARESRAADESYTTTPSVRFLYVPLLRHMTHLLFAFLLAAASLTAPAAAGQVPAREQNPALATIPFRRHPRQLRRRADRYLEGDGVQ